jgi:Icc-related predicted phosphoesterase
MSLRLVHISDTHGPKWHTRLEIPECDVLIHSGDIGGRTTLLELTEFLIWFERQPAKKKIWVAGNHDLVLDKKWAHRIGTTNGSIVGELALQYHSDAIKLIQNYNVIYLNGKDHVHEGIKFWGSPMSPSFHKEYWAFNLDRGEEIRKEWSKIPSDVDVLITHTPPHGMLDKIEEKYKSTPDEDVHRGCVDLMAVIKKRLTNLKLHCFGHIHENTGIIQVPVSQTRKVWFSNGAIMNNSGDLVYGKPLIFNL